MKRINIRRKEEEPTIEEIRKNNHIHLNVFNRQNRLKYQDSKITEQNSEDFNKVEDILKAKEVKVEPEIKVEEENINKKLKNIFKARKVETKTSENSDLPKGKKSTFIAAIVVWIIISIGVIGLIAGIILAVDMLETKPELKHEDLIAPESTTIYDVEGNIVIELGEYKRENINYDEMPNSLVNAFLSIEDSRFFTHFGFDIPRFSKAIIANLKSGSFAQGGSTFDMQLIKNTYFQIDSGSNSTIAQKQISRKVQEIVLAIEMDSKLTKQEIIALYLNRINFGNNIRGVEKAAQYYFGKSASELNLADSAFLAGIINSPNIFNPYNDLIKHNAENIYVNAKIVYLQNGEARRNEVLDMMVYHGYITKEEADLTKTISLADQLTGVSAKWSNSISYYQSYIDAVIDEAREITGQDPAITSMKIYTNMDPYMQKLVYDIQNENTEIKYNRANTQSAIVVLNNQTGELVALGGGRNQEGARQWNRATMSKIQPGSTVKPIFEYLLAFEELGWATSHTITDKPIFLYGSDHLIRNAINQYIGDMLIPEAVARSLNTPAIQALEALIDEKGNEFCIDYLESIGFDIDDETFDLQYAIGGNTFTVTPVQLAGAHAMIMNEGEFIKPHTVNHIVMGDGTTYTTEKTGEQVVSKGAAWMVSQLLYNDVYGEWFNYMQILKTGYPVFAKTGTTDWGAVNKSYGIPQGSSKDSWLVCQTSNYTNVIWLGFDQPGPGTYFTYTDDQINIKGQIGRKLLKEELDHFNYEPTNIPMPDDVRQITHVKGVYPYVEPVTGTPVTGYILKKHYELNPVSSIKYETKEGILAGMGITRSGDNEVVVTWVGVGGGGGEGMQDLTAQSLSGKVEYAVGRLYYPRVTYISPEATYYADVKVNGEVKEHIETSTPYRTVHIENIDGSHFEVCGWYSLSDKQFCTTLE